MHVNSSKIIKTGLPGAMLICSTIITSNSNGNTEENAQEAQTNPITGGGVKVPADLSAAYAGVSTGAKSYDGTGIREDIKSRAEMSRQKLIIDGEEKELELYKTKHSEYVLSTDGTKLYKLRYVENKNRIKQQVYASKLYQSVGVRTPEYIAFEKNGKTGYMVEIFEEELYPAETNKKALYKSFIADVWLGNRNGLSKGNTKIDKNGNPVKMSVSGSLGYRASGKPKSEDFGYDIDEIKTMRDSSINPDAAKALAGMTDEELYAAIEEFKAAYSYDKLKEIVEDNYWDQETRIHDLRNVLSVRRSHFDDFISNNEYDKKEHALGLDRKDNPELANVRHYDRTYSGDRDIVTKMTLEKWQTLKDRGLLRGGYNIKPFNLLDYSYLVQMSDEEHQTALKRELYKHYDIDDTYSDGIGGTDILYLSKLSDDEWKNVLKRDLLHAHVKYGKGDFWMFENVTGLAKLEDYEWQQLMLSDFLYSCPKIADVKKFLEYLNSQEANELQPSVYERTRTVLQRQQQQLSVHERRLKGYDGETTIELISLDNKRWNRMMEITNNFTDVKMNADGLLNLTNFDDEAYQILKDRGMLTEATNAYGLKDLSNLTQEDWENIDKRGIDKLPNQSYKDWAHLASLTDTEYKLAQDMHLFDDRYDGRQKYPNYLNGEEIAYIVTSLEPEDWQRVENRGLLKQYSAFNGWGLDLVNGCTMVKLAKMTDNDFSKFNQLAGYSMYPSTKFELLKLPEEQYQRIFNRDLFRYLNTHEAWDDYTEDSPILSAMSALSDEEFAKFEALASSPYKRISSKCLAIKADKLGLKDKNDLSEMSVKQKREYLQLLLDKQYSFLYPDFIENYKGGALLPKTSKELAEIVSKLVKSVGIDTKPVTQEEKAKFYNALDAISAPGSEFSKLDLKNPKFKLELDYPRDEFINDVLKLVKYMNENERNKVFDYFCFELHTAKDGQIVMSGYPALLNNGEKLAQIENPQTREVIKQLKPYIQRYTHGNKIQADGKFISADMAQTLNDIFDILPELRTTVGKRQHRTHDYTVDVHTLAVLQECINNPQFRTLNKEDQQTLIISALLHDITKEEKEIDKSHPLTGAYDAYFILKKLNLSKTQRDNIYELIRNHDFLEQCNKKIYDYSIKDKRYMTDDEQNKVIKKYAYELRSGNLGKLEEILTKADLLSVTRNGSFYDKYGYALDSISKKLDKEIKRVKATAIALPQTRIPKASDAKADGVNLVEKITYDKDGNPIKNKVLYLSKGLDLSQYGFDDGVTADDFYAITHGFDTEVQQSILDALDLPGQTALLSESYVVYSKGNYHVFRPQGFIKSVPADNIGAAYYRDFGSGCKKDIDSLLNDYINGFMYSYRNYLPKLIKQELNLTDEEYIRFYDRIKNKPMNVLEKECPEGAAALKKIFATMEIHKRKFQRNYNEILSGSGETAAVYFVGKNGENAYQLEDVPEFLRKYAESNDLLIIYFGE